MGQMYQSVWGIRTGTTPSVTGRDARAALAVALAAMESVRTGGPVDVGSVEAFEA